jgi:RNA polymerase sigma factor (sigma-70 family)
MSTRSCWPSFLTLIPSTELDRPIVEEEFCALWKCVEELVRRMVRRVLQRVSLGHERMLASARGEHADLLPRAASVRAGLCANEQFLDDLVQDVGLALLLAVRRGAVRASLSVVRSWLAVTVQRLASDRVRSAARLMFAAGDEPRDDDDGTSSHEPRVESNAARLADARMWVERLAEVLGPRDFWVVRAWFEGWSHKEIGEACGLSEPYARVVLHRALRTARELVGSVGCRGQPGDPLIFLLAAVKLNLAKLLSVHDHLTF